MKIPITEIPSEVYDFANDIVIGYCHSQFKLSSKKNTGNHAPLGW